MELIKNMKVLEQLDNNCYRILIQNKQAQLDVFSKRFILASKQYQELRKWIEVQYHINHPNIQKLYFYAHDNENVYVVREYMGKGSLRNKIKYGDLDDQTLKSISQQLLNVQQYLDKNFLYLEMNVDNVFFDESGLLKISRIEKIEHKSGKLNNKMQIGLILYECIFKRSCRQEFEIVGETVIKRPVFQKVKEISESQQQLLSEFIN